MKNYYKSILLFSVMAIALSCSKTSTVSPTTSTTTTTTTTVTKSSAKDITKFTFAALSPAVDATIDATAKTIKATVPAGTDVTKLTPTITASDKATVSPASAVAQNFSNAVTYTVTAEDGSTQSYTASVTVAAVIASTKTISSISDIPDVLTDLGDGVDYIVTKSITIDKPLTIQPGVKIQFQQQAGFYVWGTNASLNMVGTAAKPIILEGTIATAGSWYGIFVGTADLKNQWEYVTLRYSSGLIYTNSGVNAGLVLAWNSTISLKNCTFSDNQDYGVGVFDKGSNHVFTGFENNTFTNNKKSGLKISFVDVGSIDSKSTFTNNGQKYIEVVSASTDEDLTIQKTNVPFRITDIIQLRTRITLNPGANFEFGSDAGFYVAESIKSAAFIANGTAADPIKLVGYLPNTKGVWAGIALENNNIENKLDYCIISGAGSVVPDGSNFNYWYDKNATAAVIIDGTTYHGSYRATITNCTISYSAGYAIAYSQYSTNALTISNNTYSNNTKGDVIVFPY